jgi:hypothetical protein
MDAGAGGPQTSKDFDSETYNCAGLALCTYTILSEPDARKILEKEARKLNRGEWCCPWEIKCCIYQVESELVYYDSGKEVDTKPNRPDFHVSCGNGPHEQKFGEGDVIVLPHIVGGEIFPTKPPLGKVTITVKIRITRVTSKECYCK